MGLLGNATAVWRNVLKKVGPHANRPPLALLLPLTALAIAWPNLPGSQTAYTTQTPPSGNLLDLFAPLEFNGEVESQWVFYDIALLQDALRISLRKDEQKYWVYFIPAANPRRLDATCLRHFCMHIPVLPSPGDPTFQAVATSIAEILADNLDRGGALFAETRRETNLPAPWYELGFLTLLCALALVAWQGLRRTISVRDWATGVLVVIFGGGLWARLATQVTGPLHNNHHGAEELDYWLVPPEASFPSYYGRSHEALSDLLFSVLPRTYSSFLILAAVVGALSCVMAAMVTRELAGNRSGGWLAGFALACHPIAIRVAASESTFNFTLLFLLISLWALLRYRRGGTGLHLLLGHAALMLGVASHVITLPLAALPLLVLLIPPGPGATRPRLFWQLSAAVASGLVALPHALYEWGADLNRAGNLMDFAKAFQSVAGYGNLLLDPTETPWLLVILSMASTLLLWHKRWRAFLFLLALVVLAVPYYLVHVSFSDLLRYQLIPAATSVLLAGLGAEMLLRLIPMKRPRIIVNGALIVLVAANCALLSPLSRQHDAGSQEYAAQLKWAREIPQSGLLVLPRELDAHVRFHSYFPALVLQDQGLAYTTVTIPEFEEMVAAGGWPDEPVLYYEGLQLLWTMTSDDPQNPELHTRISTIVREAERIKQDANSAEAHVETIAGPALAADHALEFTELPPNATIALYRLRP